MRLGGRQKGTPNKKTQDIEELAKESGADPIEFFMLLIKGDLRDFGYNFGDDYDPEDPANLVLDKKVGAFIPRHMVPIEMRKEAAKELAPYTAAKRKSIEIRTEEVIEPPKFTINLTPSKKEIEETE